MPAKTKEKTTSVFGVYFYAVLMALFSALLGFAYMVTFPAQAFSSMQEYRASLDAEPEPAADETTAVTAAATAAPEPGDAYYIKGPVSQSRGWEAKRQQLAAPGPQKVALSAGEINAWMAAKFRPGATPEGADTPKILIVPGVPNVAITEMDTLYLNLPTTMSAYGASNEFTVFARCTVDAAAGFRFTSIQINSAKLPLPKLLGRRLFDMISRGYQSTEEYEILSNAFERAETIQVADGSLLIELR